MTATTRPQRQMADGRLDERESTEVLRLIFARDEHDAYSPSVRATGPGHGPVGTYTGYFESFDSARLLRASQELLESSEHLIQASSLQGLLTHIIAQLSATVEPNPLGLRVAQLSAEVTRVQAECSALRAEVGVLRHSRPLAAEESDSPTTPVSHQQLVAALEVARAVTEELGLGVTWTQLDGALVAEVPSDLESDFFSRVFDLRAEMALSVGIEVFERLGFEYDVAGR